MKLSHINLDELMHLFFVNDVLLFEEDYDDNYDNLTSEKDMLVKSTALHHLSGKEKDTPVHSRGTCDHFLHVVGVTCAIDMTVMASLCLNPIELAFMVKPLAFSCKKKLVDISLVLERR